MQDEIGQQLCYDGASSVVIDQSHRSEFVHKVRDTGPCRAHDFGQRLVTQRGNSGIAPVILEDSPNITEQPTTNVWGAGANESLQFTCEHFSSLGGDRTHRLNREPQSPQLALR
jgi:hypothetical protein